jgi:hypothetical protein
MTKSEAAMRKDLEEQQERAKSLLAQGRRKQVMQEFVLSSKRGLEVVEHLPFRGRTIGEDQGYQEAKRLVRSMFAKVDWIYRGAVPYPLQELMRYSDTDFAIAITQGFDVWGLVERQTEDLDARLKTWLVLGIYAYQYEFSAKALRSLVYVLTDKPCETSGSAVSILRERFGAPELDNYFDVFLRNAIDHSDFVLKDPELGRIEAWKTSKKGKIRRQYDITGVNEMTVKLLFFSMAYLSNWYSKVIELDKNGHLRLDGQNKGSAHRQTTGAG